MIKVKAKRTIFTVSVDGDIKQFTYASQRNPSKRDLLSHAKYITGSDDIKLVSRETFGILLSMNFETFYEFSFVEILKHC